jgi:hypothetical protein
LTLVLSRTEVAETLPETDDRIESAAGERKRTHIGADPSDGRSGRRSKEGGITIDGDHTMASLR